MNNKFCSTPSKLETVKVKKELLDYGVFNEVNNSSNQILTTTILSINDFQTKSSMEDFETNRQKNLAHYTTTATNRKNMIHFLEDSLRYLQKFFMKILFHS